MKDENQKVRSRTLLQVTETEFSEFQESMTVSDFWQSPTIEELAQAQGVQPLQDIRTLFGTWPGEDDDAFEEDILELRIVVARERKGRPISFPDAWIAACAVRHAIPLVTHNARHFEEIDGLEVISAAPEG